MTAIVAVDQNWAIGKDGQLLFHISADLKRFKALTMGHPVILGRKTLATFPKGRPLPGRANLILTKNPAFRVPGMYRAQNPNRVYHSVAALLRYAPADSVVIGGESVYRSLLDWCDRVYVTKIMSTVQGADAFFPNLDADPHWCVAETEAPQEENGIRFQYVTYSKAVRK